MPSRFSKNLLLVLRKCDSISWPASFAEKEQVVSLLHILGSFA
jgi:hypothetical protein